MFFFASFVLIILLLIISLVAGAPPKTYRYFGYGSNVLVSTMKALRQIEPLDATAAILPDYELRFDGSENNKLEPSAAFVTQAKNKVVHGVLYTLAAEDFAKVGSSEGVPFAYRWKKCQVYTYIGNGEDAGILSLQSQKKAVDAFTLVSTKNLVGKNNIPPSSSYLGLIKEGAKGWKFDRKYQEDLENIQEANNLIIPQGLSGMLLSLAETVTGTKRE